MSVSSRQKSLSKLLISPLVARALLRERVHVNKRILAGMARITEVRHSTANYINNCYFNSFSKAIILRCRLHTVKSEAKKTSGAIIIASMAYCVSLLKTKGILIDVLKLLSLLVRVCIHVNEIQSYSCC